MSKDIRLGIIMNGVTGRMGMNQHLIRSICAIRKDGGVVLKNGRRVMPDPILVGRNLDKVARLAKAHGIERYTDDLDAALKDQAGRLNQSLSRSRDELRADKVGREDLAALMTELALRLKGDFDLPGAR